ncbi:MAG: sugar ABC transporter permease [Gemmatimonadota bacterium]|nr:sugar ABC transporter permease [Gemmatimonadota bacterium]
MATVQATATRAGLDIRPTRPAWVRSLWAFARTYPYLLPAIVFFVGWQILPIYSALRLSFTDDRFLDQLSANFIGLDNYRRVIRDELFWRGVLRAFTFTCIFVPGMILIPMLIAVLLDRVENRFLSTFYRIVLLIPSMIPAPLIIILWVWLYNNYIGPINFILVDVLGIYDVRSQPQWLVDPQLTFFSIAVMEWWWGLGYHTMFFLAGLAAIPKDLFAAARIDGASEWRMFWGITWFRLLPIILVLMVVRFGSAMAVIDEYIIAGGYDRSRQTYTWTVYMYDTAFGGGDQFRGYAAAIGWVGALMMLIVVCFMFWLFRSRD